MSDASVSRVTASNHWQKLQVISKFLYFQGVLTVVTVADDKYF